MNDQGMLTTVQLNSQPKLLRDNNLKCVEKDNKALSHTQHLGLHRLLCILPLHLLLVLLTGLRRHPQDSCLEAEVVGCSQGVGKER